MRRSDSKASGAHQTSEGLLPKFMSWRGGLSSPSLLPAGHPRVIKPKEKGHECNIYHYWERHVRRKPSITEDAAQFVFPRPLNASGWRGADVRSEDDDEFVTHQPRLRRPRPSYVR